MSKEGSILPHKMLLLAYYFVMFGIIVGLNLQTGLQENAWGGSSSQDMKLIWNSIFDEEQNVLDNIELWYMFAGVIFLALIPIFAGLFVYYYHPNPIILQKKLRIILEFFYLSLAAGFSFVALLVPRLFLIYLPKIHPKYEYQETYLGGMTYLNQTEYAMQEWTLTFPVDGAIDDGVSSLMKIGLYFGVFFVLWVMRKQGIYTALVSKLKN